MTCTSSLKCTLFEVVGSTRALVPSSSESSSALNNALLGSASESSSGLRYSESAFPFVLDLLNMARAWRARCGVVVVVCRRVSGKGIWGRIRKCLRRTNL